MMNKFPALTRKVTLDFSNKLTCELTNAVHINDKMRQSLYYKQFTNSNYSKISIQNIVDITQAVQSLTLVRCLLSGANSLYV